MEWTNIIIAIIAAAGGCIGSMISNSRQLAIVTTKLDMLKEELQRQDYKLSNMANLSERVTALEIKMHERTGNRQ